MDSLIEAFHIDVKLLVAQGINFAVVFGALYFFALKPLVGVMAERSKTIEKSMDDAKKIEDRLARAEEEYNKKIARARKEANILIEKAQEQGGKRKKEIISKAKAEIGRIINEEKAQIQAEKARILKEIKKDVAGLVAASVEKVLEQKLDGKADEEFIRRAVKD